LDPDGEDPMGEPLPTFEDVLALLGSSNASEPKRIPLDT
jgi:hypothetical protein